MSEIEQLKAELERVTAEAYGERAELNKAKSELERVNAACAEMREALEEIRSSYWHYEDVRIADKALAADAGRGYVAVEKVKPIIEALKLMDTTEYRHLLREALVATREFLS